MLPAYIEDVKWLITQAEVISFDVFDTLLIRPFSDPKDVFWLIERQTETKGFHDARVLAENLARDEKFRNSGNYEVTLEQIYAQIKLPQFSEEKINSLKDKELQIEENILKRSPYVEGIYDFAVSLGKRIIAISDMYLSKDFITCVLLKNKFHVEQVFVSCEYGASKHEGSLYDIAGKILNIPKNRILHFGDNFKSDYSSALKAGFVAYFIPSLQEQLLQDERFNQDAIRSMMSNGSGNLFTSLILSFTAQFKAKNPQISIAKLFGAMYAGPLVSGFASWLNLVMHIDQTSHLRFATRDGYITKEVWDILGFNSKASVFHSSRRLTLIPSLVNNYQKEINTLITTNKSCTIRECIERLNFGESQIELLDALSAYVSIDKELNTPSIISKAINALNECKPILLRIALKELNSYKYYLEFEKFDPKQDALVDCGWALSSQRRTEIILKEKIKGYYIGTLAHAYMHDGIRSFLFHHGQNRDWIKIAEAGVELLELPFASNKKQVNNFEMINGNLKPIMTENEKQYAIVIDNFVMGMQSEIKLFAQYFAPYTKIVTQDELRSSLFDLFNNLVNKPTLYEASGLSSLPHNRELGASDFATIGTFWITNNGQHADFQHKTTWHDYIKLGWLSYRQVGFALTWSRTKRVLRRHFKS